MGATLGLYQKEQPPRPREQAILQPRQEDGQGLRKRSYPCFRYGQIPFCPFVLNHPIAFWLGVILKLRTQSREFNISEDFKYQSTSILPPLIFYGSISEHSSKIQKDPFHNYS